MHEVVVRALRRASGLLCSLDWSYSKSAIILWTVTGRGDKKSEIHVFPFMTFMLTARCQTLCSLEEPLKFTVVCLCCSFLQKKKNFACVAWCEPRVSSTMSLTWEIVKRVLAGLGERYRTLYGKIKCIKPFVAPFCELHCVVGTVAGFWKAVT